MLVFSGRAKRELSRIELALAITLMAVFVAMFLDKANGVLARVEQSAVTTRISQLQTVLSVKLFEHIVRSDLEEFLVLEGSNPMRLVAEPPEDYAGELDAPDLRAMRPGTWYFDPSSKHLVYRVRYDEFLNSPLRGPGRIRFTVRLSYTDANGSGRFEHGVDTLHGIKLAPREPFTWLDPSDV